MKFTNCCLELFISVTNLIVFFKRRYTRYRYQVGLYILVDPPLRLLYLLPSQLFSLLSPKKQRFHWHWEGFLCVQSVWDVVYTFTLFCSGLRLSVSSSSSAHCRFRGIKNNDEDIIPPLDNRRLTKIITCLVDCTVAVTPALGKRRRQWLT